jgi:hypothetical protein
MAVSNANAFTRLAGRAKISGELMTGHTMVESFDKAKSAPEISAPPDRGCAQ